jgi:hypothetical protein
MIARAARAFQERKGANEEWESRRDRAYQTSLSEALSEVSNNVMQVLMESKYREGSETEQRLCHMLKDTAAKIAEMPRVFLKPSAQTTYLRLAVDNT